MSILYGMARVLSPVLSEPDAGSAQLLSCIGALGVYELALLAVLAIIAVKRGVTDDAVSLVVLAALFLSVGGILVAFMPQKDPGATLAVGFACLLMAGGKLYVLRRLVGLRLPPLAAAGVGMHFVWCFLQAPIMSFMVTLESADALWRAWLNGWLVLLAGVALLLAHLWRTPTGVSRQAHRESCFLRAPGMAWVFAAVLIAVSCLHNYALTYIFDLRLTFSDHLPLIALVSLAAMELMRAYGKRLGTAELAVASTPLLLIVIGPLVSPVAAVEGTRAIRLLWHPGVLTAAMGAMLVLMARREQRVRLLYVAALYALGVGMAVSWRKGGRKAAVSQKRSDRERVSPTSFDYALFVGSLVLVLVCLLASSCEQAANHARGARCMANLAELGKAMKMWSMDNSERCPGNMACLASGGYASNPRLYICPNGDTCYEDVCTDKNIDTWSDYVLVPNLRESDPMACVHAYDRPGNHKEGGNVLHLDGSVTWFGRKELKRLFSTPSEFFGTSDPEKIADLIERTGRFRE